MISDADTHKLATMTILHLIAAKTFECSQNDQTCCYALSSSRSHFLLHWGASGKVARNKLVSPKTIFKRLTLPASFLKGSWDTGRKGVESCIPGCRPLPHNTFLEGSSISSQSLSKCALITFLGWVQCPQERSVGVLKQSAGIAGVFLKVSIQERPFKIQITCKEKGWIAEIPSPSRKYGPVEVSVSAPNPFHDIPVHGELCFSRPPHFSCSIFLVAVIISTYAQPSCVQEDAPRHQLWLHHLQATTFQRKPAKK